MNEMRLDGNFVQFVRKQIVSIEDKMHETLEVEWNEFENRLRK